jgi:PAS domain S-box-containing protein
VETNDDTLLRHPFSGLLFESLPLGIVVQNSVGEIVTANTAATRILGLSLDQMRGITSIDPRWHSVHEDGSPFPGKDHPAMVALQTGQTVLDTLMGVFNPKLGDLTWININAFAIKEGATGAIKGAYAVIEDITSRTKAQQQEKESEERFRSLFYAMSEGVALHQVIYDDLGKAKDYLILDVNPAFERQTGLTRAQVLGKCAVEAYGTPEAPFLEIYAAVAHTQKPTTFQTEFAQLGKHFSVRVFSPRRDYFATVFEDVTERHRTESALKATQAELAEAQRLAQLGSWYWDAKTDQNIASDELCRIYGRDHIPAFAQQNGLMYPEQTWQQLNAAAQEATRTGTGFNLEVPALRGDGTLFWINTRCLAVRDPGGDVVGLRGTVQDITQRKLAEVSLQRLYSMMERTEKMAHLASFEWDIDANKVTWSPEMFRIFGRDPALGTPNLQTIAELFTPESAQLLHDAVDKAVSEGTAYELELMTLQPDAEQRPCFAHGFPERDASGRVVRLAGLVQDITERKQTQDALIQSLKDKQALLHEVHHRVKNNLQVIVSLLRLEALRSTQTDTKAVLADMQGRIRSMAFLHESLYRSGVFASIELGSYLRGLATQVFRGQANASDTVRLVVDFTPVQVSMDLATPCGLLVNELISNCLKHGFPKEHSGEVRFELHPANPETSQVDALWRLCVSDNGVGLPPDFEARRNTSLGLQLVDDLSRQMSGTLAIQSQPGNGTEFCVTFKI